MSVTFETVLSAFGKNTGIVVPDSVIEQLGAGQRPPVSVDLHGYVYRNTVAVMDGQHLLSVSSQIRKATGLVGGDPIRVTLTLDTTPREVKMPADFGIALDAQPAARAFFETLANSLQRYHIDNVNGTNNPATRQRRIDKAVEGFLAGKKR